MRVPLSARSGFRRRSGSTSVSLTNAYNIFWPLVILFGRPYAAIYANICQYMSPNLDLPTVHTFCLFISKTSQMANLLHIWKIVERHTLPGVTNDSSVERRLVLSTSGALHPAGEAHVPAALVGTRPRKASVPP